ncbi:hypothetical protein P7C70_g8788, partial [Phenoliferia sp. Uapishka_3]
MPNHRSSTPDFIILSSDPPTPFIPAVRKQVARISTGGKPPARPKTPLDAGYKWAATRIEKIKKSALHYLIDFLPTELTLAEYHFWAVREDFAGELPMNAEGRILVTFFPSWQLHYDASAELVAHWESRKWEEVYLSPEDL